MNKTAPKIVEQAFSFMPLVLTIQDSYKLLIPGGLNEVQLGWVFWPRQTWRGPAPAGSG